MGGRTSLACRLLFHEGLPTRAGGAPGRALHYKAVERTGQVRGDAAKCRQRLGQENAWQSHVPPCLLQLSTHFSGTVIDDRKIKKPLQVLFLN